jgi:hypothetical protein
MSFAIMPTLSGEIREVGSMPLDALPTAGKDAPTMTWPLYRSALGFLFALTIGACVEPARERVGGDEQEWVQASVFDRMSKVVETIDYLPFRYKLDGCYSRALYMAMELAANDFESNVVFAFAQPGAPLHVGTVEWDYHVAPLLHVGPSADRLTPMVIDPALSRSPLARDQWLTKLGHGPGDPAPPQLLMVPGSVYGTGAAEEEVEWKNVDMPDFAHLPPFKLSDIQHACALMHGYLKRESDGLGQATPENAFDAGSEAAEAALLEAKRERLVTRTQAIITTLEQKGKLTKDNPYFNPYKCRSNTTTF